MSLDPETESSSSTTTTKRSQYRVFIDKVAKLFRSSKCFSQESPDPRKCMYFDLSIVFHFFLMF